MFPHTARHGEARVPERVRAPPCLRMPERVPALPRLKFQGFQTKARSVREDNGVNRKVLGVAQVD